MAAGLNTHILSVLVQNKPGVLAYRWPDLPTRLQHRVTRGRASRVT